MNANIALKINVRFILLSLLLLLIQPLCLYAASPNAPDNLRSCDKAHPIGTDDKPYFGWYVNDPDDDDDDAAYEAFDDED